MGLSDEQEAVDRFDQVWAENLQLKTDIEHERQQNGQLRERVERQAATIRDLEPRISALRLAMRAACADLDGHPLTDALMADTQAAAAPEETES